jgi:outer membrane protein OmpA-like peptidoglycan-associated protein
MFVFRFVILTLILLCSTFSYAQSNESDSSGRGANSIVVTSSVDKNKGPGFPVGTFSLDKKVYVYLTLGDPIESQPKVLQARWYNCNKLVGVKDIISEPKKNPHHVWFWIDAKELGAGTGRVDIVVNNDTLFARSVFQVKNTQDNIVQCGITPQVINLSSDALFAFGKFELFSISPGGHERLRELIQQVKSGYSSIAKIDIIGHTDNIGSASENMQLSRKRANTIKEIFVANGFPSQLINAVGMGESQTTSNCNDKLMSPLQLISCKSIDRKVVIKILGEESLGTHEYIGR